MGHFTAKGGVSINQDEVSSNLHTDPLRSGVDVPDVVRKVEKKVTFGSVLIQGGKESSRHFSALVPESSLQTAPKPELETLSPTPSELRAGKGLIYFDQPSELRAGKGLIYFDHQQNIKKLTRQLKGLIESEIDERCNRDDASKESVATKYLLDLAKVNPIRIEICKHIFKERFDKELEMPDNYKAEASPESNLDSSNIEKAFNELNKGYEKLLKLHSAHDVGGRLQRNNEGVGTQKSGDVVVPKSSLQTGLPEQRSSLPIPYPLNTNSGHDCLPSPSVIRMRPSLTLNIQAGTAGDGRFSI